jgi:hypothetical protein
LVNGATKVVAGGAQTGGVIENWKQFDYGKVSFDATHIFSTSFTVESPWGRNLTGLAGAAVKGWSLSALMHYQTGSPLTATATQAVGNSGQSFGRRATIVGGQSIGFSGPCLNAQGMPAHAICWVNPNAFSAAGASNAPTEASVLGAGDTPVSDIIGPNYYQWDASVRKTFALPFREWRIQFQADAFNAFNRANWNNPTVNNAGTSSFGQITGSLPGRVLQFGGKFSF